MNQKLIINRGFENALSAIKIVIHKNKNQQNRHGNPPAKNKVKRRAEQQLSKRTNSSFLTLLASVNRFGVRNSDFNTRFANSADRDHVLSNQTAAFTPPFTVLQDSWVQLSPYGDFPHSRGLQRVDRNSADRMVANFSSFSARLGRRFGGVPFYVGHPDSPDSAADYPDKKAYGWVMALEAREDGLYGQIKWSKAGQELVENAHYKYLSPFWQVRHVRLNDGTIVCHPETLISVGLTNQPNLPVLPLSNTTVSEFPSSPLPGESSPVGNYRPAD